MERHSASLVSVELERPSDEWDIKGFEMKILYYDTVQYKEVEKEIRARKVSLDELLSKSDFISINLPMLPETKGLIGEREFGLLKPTAYIINLARGPIWDEKALYTVLKEGKNSRCSLRCFRGGARHKRSSSFPVREFYRNASYGRSYGRGSWEDEQGGRGCYKGSGGKGADPPSQSSSPMSIVKV